MNPAAHAFFERNPDARYWYYNRNTRILNPKVWRDPNYHSDPGLIPLNNWSIPYAERGAVMVRPNPLQWIRYTFGGTRRANGGARRVGIVGLAVLAAIALGAAPLCIPPAQAHADDPCVSITDPAGNQTCSDYSLRDEILHRYQGNCQASPLYGQLGQLCRD